MIKTNPKETIEIYGSTIILPEKPDDSEIINSNLPREQQKWVKPPLPPFFSTVEFTKNGDLMLTVQQEEFARREVRRCKEGVWVYINGAARFIPPKYYFYLQYYILEDGIPPDFREADRRWFLFLRYWESMEWPLGICRTKKRRAGASSQACSNLLYEAIFFKNSNCGLISKSREDSKDTFTEMVTASYRQLPVFLKPKQVNKEDSVTELIFAHKSQTNKEGVVSAIRDDEGHRSKITYRAPVLNAFDRSRQSRVLLDEGAKYPKETPTSQLLSIISKTLLKGVRRVGFIELCSTVNEMTAGGGAEYFKIWKNANQFKKRPTINRLVRFFQPAYEAYDGYIDAYGDSVIGEPTEEQYEYLVKKWVKYDEETGECISELTEEDIRLGALHYIKVKRREGLEGIALEEEIRQNPCDEDEAFLSAVSDCAFNSLKIKARQKYLEDNPIFKRKVIFFRDEDQNVQLRDAQPNDALFWSLTWLPPKGHANKFIMLDGRKAPAMASDGAIAVDGYANSQGGRRYGSKASAFIGRRSDLIDPHNTGKAIGHLYGRPQVKETLHEQVMLAAEYYSYPIYYEHTADDYLSHFRERGKINYLGRYPLSLIDPNKREGADRFRGTPITPFSLTKQLDNGIAYFEYHCDRIDFEAILENALIFDPYDRTAYDTMVSFLILISVLMEPVYKPTPPPEPLVATYGANFSEN